MYQYQVSFGQAISRAFSKYCCFTGRASRSEFWWFVLFNFLVSMVLSIPAGFTAGINIADAIKSGATEVPTSGMSAWSIISYIWSLIILLPSMGLLWRRLHDTGRSGWNWCWGLLPVIGWIILLVYECQQSQPVENKYGPVPNLTQA